MEVFIVIVIMVLVGALIGGVTNSLAIKMLFRPYRAYYIGGWRVPFTPGLIPKRRGELADQLGKLVVNHLLTPEGLQKKLQDKFFMNEMTAWVQGEVRNFLQSKETLEDVLEKWAGITHGKEKVQLKLDEWMTNRTDAIIHELRPLPLNDLIPKNLNEKVEAYIPKLTVVFIEKGKNYFSSPEGIERLSNMVDRFLAGRGALGNMVSMFLGNERLVDKLQPEIMKMLSDDGTHQLIEVFLKKEWEQVKQLKVEEVEKHINLKEVATYVQAKIMENVPLAYLDKPLDEWTAIIEKPLVEEVVPRALDKIGQAVSKELVHLLKKLHLEEVVKDQVEQFSVSRLEDMVLSISRRELKLITYLGALLGGLIGLFQGIFIIFLS
ncbi:DUF445 domain-containing protein [Anaerobacillus isosaccharinicus]|uniref:DUF445 domain-containing protein n=1 Tax=Anaerobacillus isosaccharinicus TaxID=1532552 RepID=A0A7S7RBZ3_9BACI|nr:DUF445 family protein [Anaerobacillus isosaccharinicus]MBA5585295.1 DUF445 family protein [Anaerobacillus isosaccharinicus]QOY36378.1 DUF445 domain-containing protein [Anaerobacillus isosaccharinicus]